LTQTVDAQDLYSFPADSWRSIRNTGSQAAEFVLMTAGDHKKRIVWSDEVRNEAAKLGYAIDHNGYVAPLALPAAEGEREFCCLASPVPKLTWDLALGGRDVTASRPGLQT
jgi:hypothetical protein